MCNYEGRTTSFLPRRLEREPMVKCCLQGYLQVIPKRLLKLLLRSRWLSIKKVQVFNPEEYGPINLSIFHENVQCCLTNDLLTKHLQVTFAVPTLQSAACRCLCGERQRCYSVYHTVTLAVENHSIHIGRKSLNQKKKKNKILLHYSEEKVRGLTIAAFHNCSHETLVFHDVT